MKKYLEILGFTEKEANCYLALLEFGMQPASVIAKKTNYPKSTVLFFFDRLVDLGYVRRSHKGRVQFFYADPNDLKKSKSLEIEKQQKSLEEVVPLLEEIKSPFSSQPKVTFYDGLTGCKKIYSELLDSQTDILEFGAHEDLVEKFGEDFMKNFIRKRVKNKLYLHAVCQKNATSAKLEGKNKAHLRDMKLFDEKYGKFFSSICVFENKVLLLNLYRDAFAILIENNEVAQTLKTIHNLVSGVKTD